MAMWNFIVNYANWLERMKIHLTDLQEDHEVLFIIIGLVCLILVLEHHQMDSKNSEGSNFMIKT